MIFGECCDCECHEEGRNIFHCAPCCYSCPHCNKNIDRSCWSNHARKCQDIHDPMIGNGVRLNAVIEALMTLQQAGLNTSSTSMHLNEILNNLTNRTSAKDPD
jgi:hypothetical protein